MTTTPETQAALENLAIAGSPREVEYFQSCLARDIRLVLAHVATLEAEIAGKDKAIENLNRHTGHWVDRFETAQCERDEIKTAYSVGLREAIRLANSLYRSYRDLAPNWKPLDDVAGVISQIDNMAAGFRNDLDSAKTELSTTLEHNRVLREALAEYLALSSTDGRSERQQLRAKLKELIALTPADVESELTRLRKALAASCSDERSLAISEGPMHGICPLAEGYRAEAFQLGAAVELAMAAEVNYVKERDQLRSHISALIAAGDALARWHDKEQWANKETSAWSTAKSTAQSNLP